ncbi:M48 family metallopeptidase [Halioxenophilus aromaticivorans]|uniref:SprT family zinc-dependent metalloprotease n=1 Tax=Halioxenophilus aromaticivorans TaxID=1306992 RepID=A0AAV3U3A4_9ALTE
MATQSLKSTHLPFNYTLRRSARRKTIEIQVRGDQVVVRAPNFVHQGDIQRFVLARAAWVQEKLSLYRQRALLYPPRTYEPGARWWFCGQPYSLDVRVAAVDRVEIQDQSLRVVVSRRKVRDPQAKLERLLSQWYQQQAMAVLTHKTEQLTRQMGLRYQQIKLRKTRSRWGHCTHDGSLQFNWLIMQAPEPVIDYLVAHEVCHLQHFDHSLRFWSLVGKVCPEYQAAKTWLQHHGHCLWF